MKISVVGLGNIGLNLLRFLQRKFPGEVRGVDIREERIKELRNLAYPVTSDYSVLKDTDIWLLATSTGSRGENLFAALEQLIIKAGALISIESTLPPGTMFRVRDFLKQKGWTVGNDVYLIHVPHRVMFGVDKTVCDGPRVMGAFTPSCLEKGRRFYAPLVPQLIETTDIRIAELSKVIENSKRYLDVAFAQEIYRYCVDQGLAYKELRQAVNSKGNVELLGCDWGIGGECLPKDLGFLKAVFESPLLEGAEQAEREYRERIVKQVGRGKRVLVRGISYKKGVKDVKHSRGVDLVRALEAAGNEVWTEDPLYSADELRREGFRAGKADPREGEEPLKPGDQGWVVLERDDALRPRLE